MIVCPNCNHPNPDGAVQCEACYTPLPATTTCPSCAAVVQADASFCGQCGYNLRAAAQAAGSPTIAPDIPMELPPLNAPDPMMEEQPVVVTSSGHYHSSAPEPLPATAVVVPEPETASIPSNPPLPPQQLPTVAVEPETSSFTTAEPETSASPTPITAPATGNVSKTQLQQLTGRLVHVQSDRLIELPQNLSVIHIGKQNDRIPPDIDVSGFANSEIVSRIHADIRVEGEAFYIEDVGSSNGTYINNLPLLPGNRHRLRAGDRISLGKGDMVTFLFQQS